jgi:hypothetical protein
MSVTKVSENKQNFIPMSVIGLEHMIDRAWRESGKHQYIRETLVNAIEAKASRIHYGVDWEHFNKSNHFRLMICDNGHGMSSDELHHYMSSFGGSSKLVGGMHQNYGIGAKTSLAPWNPLGVVVSSWTKENPSGTAVRIIKKGDVYGIEDAPVSKNRPAWMQTGTMIVCHGSNENPDTYFGPDGAGKKGFLAEYVEKRFWELPIQVSMEIPTRDRPKTKQHFKTTNLHGIKQDLLIDTKLNAMGTIDMKNAMLRWYIVKQPDDRVCIALLYKGELYDITHHATTYAKFALFLKEVRERVCIIIEPQPFDYNRGYGCFPNAARSHLYWWENGHQADHIPLDDWAHKFAENIPEQIRILQEQLSETKVDRSDKWKQQVALFLPYFKHHFRWFSKGDVAYKDHIKSVTINAESTRSEKEREEGKESNPKPPKSVDFPDFRFIAREHFDRNVAGMWIPPHADAPRGEAVMNKDFITFVDVIERWALAYPNVPKPEIENLVHTVYGTIVISKLIHATSLIPDPDWGKERVEEKMYSPEAITMAVLGLIDADKTIRTTLTHKYGKPQTEV